MSTTRRQPVFLGLSILLGLVGFIYAQPADPLEQKRLELNIQAQKLLREVSANFAEAQSLSRTNPEKARKILRDTRGMLEDDNLSLSERQRKDLLRQVEAKLLDVDGRARVQKRDDDLAAAQAAEAIRLKKKLADDDIKATAGISPSMVIDARIASVTAQKKMMMAYLERLKAQTPDKYYGQTDKGKPKFKEIEIMKMLNSTMSVDFKGDDFTLKKALDYIDDKTEGKLNMLLDDPALKDVPIVPEEKVIPPLKMKKFAVRTIMKELLIPNGLDYYIDDGALRISSEKKAKEKLVIKMYPIRNLVGGGAMMNPQMAMMMGNQAKQKAQSLALLVMNTIQPDYWELTGTGPGKIDWDQNSMTLVIKASVEVHYMLKASELLDNNRPPGVLPLQ